MKVAFPEATQLGLEADVRVAGVSVGKVVKKDVDRAHPNRTVATLAARPASSRRCHSDARAILRQKTLLGETYVELTPGNPKGAEDPRERLAGGLAASQNTVELDEIFQALDPVTRRAFQNWQQSLAQGRSDGATRAAATSTTRSATCRGFAPGRDRRADGPRRAERAPCSRLVRNTGVVFSALTQNEAQLHNLITNSADVFDATQKEKEALAADLPDLPDVPRRVQGDVRRAWRRSRRTPTR